MMDFISIPTVIGIIAYAIYKLFELFVRKNERLTIIDKLGDKLSSSNTDLNLNIPTLFENTGKFNTLKFACLLLGVGLGLLIGYLICYNSVPGFVTGNFADHAYESVSVVYGASVLLFGGLGLLVAFLVEMNYLKKKSEGK